MATPSIAIIPSGYKATKVYSVLPTNGDGDLTFARNNTGTRVNKSGLIEGMATDVPRLDYSDGSCPSLLLEPASLNLALYSQEFTNSYWGIGNTIRTSGFLSPSGTLDACLVKKNNDTYLASTGTTLTSSSTYTLSVYLKAKTPTTFKLKLQELGGDFTNYFESEITLTTDWVRYEVTGQKGADGNPARIVFNNISDSEEFFVWGAQLEEKPHATSYIPTTSGTASRSAESSSKTGLSSYISSTAGVLYTELSTVLSTDPKRISLSDGSSLNRVEFGFDVASNLLKIIIKENNNNIINTSEVISSDITSFIKVAIKYESGDTKVFVNGVLLGTPSTVSFSNIGTLDRLNFSTYTSSSIFQGKVRDARVYNTTLSDAELTTLTTI